MELKAIDAGGEYFLMLMGFWRLEDSRAEISLL
jgi:hypothetical protein